MSFDPRGLRAYTEHKHSIFKENNTTMCCLSHILVYKKTLIRCINFAKGENVLYIQAPNYKDITNIVWNDH